MSENSDDQRERNKAVIRHYFAAYDTGDANAVWRFLDAEHLYYPPGGSEPMNLEGRKRDELFFFEAFSNIHTTVDDQMAESDKVASRVTMLADHTGEYQKIPPTGTRVKFVFMDVSRVVSGKIIEEWTEFDMIGILQQLKRKKDSG